MAEDFGARAESPQIACLQGVRQADLTLLVLFDRYGSPQGSSLHSPTHEEYLEARGADRPVLVFVQEGVDREAAQTAFVDEVGAWEGGHLRLGFRTPEELKDRIVLALRDFEVAHATGPVDPAALINAALAAFPQNTRGYQETATLDIAVAGGPRRQVIRPVDLEAKALEEFLQREAMFGPHRVLETREATLVAIEHDALKLSQRSAMVRLDEYGTLLARRSLASWQREDERHGPMQIVEDDVAAGVANVLSFVASVLEEVDPLRRLSHLAIATRVTDSGSHSWVTREQAAINRSRGTYRMRTGDRSDPVHTIQPRGALQFKALEIAQDLTVKMRRQAS